VVLYLVIGATGSSETSVPICQTTFYHIPENLPSNLVQHFDNATFSSSFPLSSPLSSVFRSNFSFGGEGPRSRSYGRTAALRPLWWSWRERLQVFSFFQVMQHQWNETDKGKPKYSGKKPVPVPLCPPQIPRGPTRGLRGGRPATNRLSHGTAFPL
jgi:hypothetical protein